MPDPRPEGDRKGRCTDPRVGDTVRRIGVLPGKNADLRWKTLTASLRGQRDCRRGLQGEAYSHDF
jgi:hypothetical protein